MMREKALCLLDEHIQNENLKKHLFAVEALMRALARKFNQDEEIWGLAGLVHDLDWEETKETPEEHSLIAAAVLEKEGFPKEIIQAVKVHNHIHGFEPESLLEKALYSTEEITGLIVACALVQPSKKLKDVTVDSVLKKFKEKSFAAGVDRNIILKSEEYLKLGLNELIQLALDAMISINEVLGLS
ncbi:MAG: HDIG domain-containing protein [Patescibacteria group bacterium]|nr:HDIG domain-containing protein [Patescibacteria group bacterium]